jgi:hypothetical protein
VLISFIAFRFLKSRLVWKLNGYVKIRITKYGRETPESFRIFFPMRPNQRLAA